MLKKLKPKYLLLSTPSLTFTNSTHDHSINYKSFDSPAPIVQYANRMITEPSQVDE